MLFSITDTTGNDVVAPIVIDASDYFFGPKLQIENLDNGNFAVQWIAADGDPFSIDHVYTTVLDPSGNEISTFHAINTAASGSPNFVMEGLAGDGGILFASVEKLADGTTGLVGRIFNEAGTLQGNAMVLQPDFGPYRPNGPNRNNLQDAIGTEDGGFILSWWDGTNDGKRLYVQMFDALGNTLGQAVQVGIASSDGSGSNLDITASGDLLITWDRYSDVNGIDGVYSQLIDVTATGLGDPIWLG